MRTITEEVLAFADVETRDVEVGNEALSLCSVPGTEAVKGLLCGGEVKDGRQKAENKT